LPQISAEASIRAQRVLISYAAKSNGVMQVTYTPYSSHVERDKRDGL
jgi:hypothetical protein